MSATAFQRMRREKELSEREKKEAFNQEFLKRSQEFKDKLEEAQALNAKLRQELLEKKKLGNEEPKTLEYFKVEDLKVLAKEKGIIGYSNMKRADLIEALRG